MIYVGFIANHDGLLDSGNDYLKTSTSLNWKKQTAHPYSCRDSSVTGLIDILNIIILLEMVHYSANDLILIFCNMMIRLCATPGSTTPHTLRTSVYNIHEAYTANPHELRALCVLNFH